MKQKNFKEIYEDIYKNVGKKIEKERKSVLLKIIFVNILVFIFYLVLGYYGVTRRSTFIIVLIYIGVFCSFIFMPMIILRMNKKYKETFKELIINEIVEKSNPNFMYSAKMGVSSSEYSKSGFERYWDRFFSEDLVEGTLADGSKVKMSQVTTQQKRETVDENGNTQTYYVTTFFGLYGIINLKVPTSVDFAIINNSKMSKFNEKRIEMESSEFEKYYDVFNCLDSSSLRQSAMEILTPEAIEQFVKIRNLFKKSVNIRVWNDKIFFRIFIGDIFEPPTFKSSINFDLLHKYFLIIDMPRMIYEAMIDNILVMYGDEKIREARNISNMSDEEREKYLKIKKEEEEKTYFSHK